MEMDKRTLIGIILIGAIVFFTPYLQRMISGPPAQQEETVDTPTGNEAEETGGKNSRVDAVDTGKKSPAVYSSEDNPQATDEPREALAADDISDFVSQSPESLDIKVIKVTTDRYQALFSTKGADLTSFILNDYEYSFADDNVNMVPEWAANVLPYEFQIGKQMHQTSDYVFESKNGTELTLDGNDAVDTLTFSRYVEGRYKITRSYIFNNHDFFIQHDIEIVTLGDENVEKGILWWDSGLSPTEKDVKDDLSQFEVSYKMGGEIADKDFKKDDELKLEQSGNTDWIATKTKYFAVILSSHADVAHDGIKVRGEWHKNLEFFAELYDVPELDIGLVKEGANSQTFKASALIYIGGQDYFILKSYERDYEELVDMGWSWLEPLSYALLWVMNKINSVIPNYGLVIIIFTILIKLILHPLTSKYMRSMRDMKKIQPKMESLKEQYKNDPQKLNQEMLKLYKEHGVNPLGGCLPMLLQMPIFFALFRVFRNTIELRGQPFIFWITDLSQKDPYYILPILMGVMMFLQQKMTIKDPKQKLMVYLMPVFFLFLFRNMPAGLVLYWTCFNVLTFIYQSYMELKDKENTPELGQFGQLDQRGKIEAE